MSWVVQTQTEEGWQAADVGNQVVAAEAIRTAFIRAEMLTAFLKQMNAEKIPYCLLNGFQGYPEVIASDVDFMVRSCDSKKVAPLLLEVAQQCGALLVQAIQHETGAWYFVLARQEGNAVAYLHPDCSTDYRRDGRLWLAADEVLKTRQRFKTFFVPSIADEFLYYLIKKILKQRITEPELQRIAALYLSFPDECSARMRRFWPERTVKAIEPALARQELGWFQFYGPTLLSELRASAPAEGSWRRLRQRTREWRRWLERALNPTGMSIAVCAGTAPQREELARGLEEKLRPAFRRTLICGDEVAGGAKRDAVSIWVAKVSSTLVIRKQDTVRAQWFGRNELCFVFGNPAPGAPMRERHVALDDTRSLQENLEFGTRVALEWLAARLQRRLKLQGPSPAQPGAERRTRGAA